MRLTFTPLAESAVNVVRILHGARDLPAQFQSDSDDQP